MAEATGVSIDTLEIQVRATANSAIATMSQLSAKLSEMTARLLDLRDALADIPSTNIEINGHISRTGKEVDGAGKKVKEMTKHTRKATSALGELAKSFARIAMYRAIRSIIKDISAAIKEGLTNLYDYSKEVGTVFAPAVDNLRRHVLLLKNAFATALRPAIEAIIPIIIQLVDWLSKMADFAAQVLSVLFNKLDSKGRYTKAILADLKDSNKQAKELRRTLLGFDEINRLNGDTGSGESSGAGLMFTQAEVSPEAMVAAEKLRNIIEKIKEILGAIDWEVILKIFAAIKGAKMLAKIWEWLKGIAAILGSTVGIVIAIIAVFGMWGDKIKEFIDKKAIPKVDEFFNNLRKKVKSGGILDALLKILQDIVKYVLGVFGDIANIVHQLFHGDFKGALDSAKGMFRNFWDFLKTMFDDTFGWIWNKVLAPFFEKFFGKISDSDVEGKNKFIDFQLFFLKGLQLLLLGVNDILSRISDRINMLIEWMNDTFGTNIDPIDLHIDTTELDAKVRELEKMKLKPLTEDVTVRGSWKQNSMKFVLDTGDANRAIDSLSTRIKNLGKSFTDWWNKVTGKSGSNSGNSGSPAGSSLTKYASGGFPSVGSLFIAGERGAEYITSFGGQTGVYNTDQMAAAMYNAMSAALHNMPQQGCGDIYLDGEVIYRNVVNRNNNQVRSTGRAALLT